MRKQWSYETNIKQGPAAVPIATTIIGTVLSQAMNKAPKAPKADDTPVTVMPTQDSALVADAKRRALIAQSVKGGRSSTVLTDSDDSFGGN